jgi:hypothetical protein
MLCRALSKLNIGDLSLGYAIGSAARERNVFWPLPLDTRMSSYRANVFFKKDQR